MRKGETLSSLARTGSVLAGGVLLSVVLGSVLTMTLAPDAGRLLGYQMGWVPFPASPSRIEIARQLRMNTLVVRWVITPLVGVGVGLFVGLLQRSRPALAAAICLAPTTWKGSYYPIRFYPYPLIERAQIVAPDFLSILCAILVAVGIWRLRNRKKPNMAEVTVTQG